MHLHTILLTGIKQEDEITSLRVQIVSYDCCIAPNSEIIFLTDIISTRGPCATPSKWCSMLICLHAVSLQLWCEVLRERCGENLKKKKNKINKDNGLKIIAAVRRRNKPLRRLRANYPFAMCTGVTITAKPPEVSPTPLIRARLKNKIKRVPWLSCLDPEGNTWFIYLFLYLRQRLVSFHRQMRWKRMSILKSATFKVTGFIFRGKGKKSMRQGQMMPHVQSLRARW